MVIMLYLAIVYFLLVSFLAWKNFRWALGILIIALPAYLVRFNIGPLPTTLLEVTFGALFLIWLVKYSRTDGKIIKESVKIHQLFFVFLALFFTASIAGIFISDMWWASLGQWRAYFLEPILLFFVLLGREKSLEKKDLVWFLLLSSISVSLLAIIQKITGQLYPPSLWDDQLFGRVTSFFTTPNAVGLYLVPVVIMTASFFARSITTKQSFGRSEIASSGFALLAMTLLALCAIFLSFSQGAWVALGAGIICFAFLIGYKKIAVAVALIGIIAALVMPQVRSAVLFQDQAGQNRLTLWKHSWTYLTKSPQNFIFGAGIRQYFRKVEKPYYNPQELERLIYPHNIFLNFWTEIGLLGLIGFIGLMVCGFRMVWQKKKDNKILAASLISALVVIMVHGVVDVPYFKNDLSMIFWIIMSLVIV